MNKLFFLGAFLFFLAVNSLYAQESTPIIDIKEPVKVISKNQENNSSSRQPQGESSINKARMYGLSYILRGGYQALAEQNTGGGIAVTHGGVFENTFNMDITYVYFQVSIGWSSMWSKQGVLRAASDPTRSSSAFNEGWYLGLGTGFIIPQIGLRFGVGVQMSFELLWNSTNPAYAGEFVPYVDLGYELEFVKDMKWVLTFRSVLSKYPLLTQLVPNKYFGSIEVQTGFAFYVL